MARFMRKGVSKVFFVPTIAATTTLIPTAAEVTAGTALTGSISDISGFGIVSTDIDTPDMANAFTSSIPGELKADGNSITFYEDDTASTIETALVRGTAGFVVLARKGYATGKLLDVFPVRVGSRAPAYTAANEAAKFVVNFSVTSPPVQDVVMGSVP